VKNTEWNGILKLIIGVKDYFEPKFDGFSQGFV
jgi:hypothetical protein